ncbi:hypothetical protein PR202_ga02193 [Eleusine coracana subsp. coracana]|uniref:Uncharacterized protein n=1 Tax=Eleusine coracana subsp. coracana TaxID=191504 RepID=A0AAV5BIT2_ELECO|nr:hypothetical protein PR202_ga02193 [Eleusine coracana subsp. coracana]
MENEGVVDGSMEVYEVLSAEEVQSFAARLEVTPDILRHIIDSMDGVAGINLRQELEEWVSEHLEQKERIRGMTLEQLVTDTRATLIPTVTADLRRAQDLLAALDREEEEEKARKHAPRAAL